MSYCDCDYSDADPPQFCNRWIVKSARKKFKCDECHGPILVGESYQKTEGKWFDGIETYRECGLCMELREWAIISMPCFCAYTFGELHERVQEMVQDVAPKTPGFFFEYGRRMVKIRERRRSNDASPAP